MTFLSNKTLTKHLNYKTFQKSLHFQDYAVILETNHILEISNITCIYLNSLSHYFIGYI